MVSRNADREFVKLPLEAQLALIAGARDLEPVRGLTHGYYKYPARFSPAFVRSAITTFTQPGDLGSGLIDHSQKMTTAAMQIADMKVWAHRS